MFGAFLTLLDDEGRILFFAGGAMRRRMNAETDRVLIRTPEDIVRSVVERDSAADYRAVDITGSARSRHYDVAFREVPFLTLMLASAFPRATSWSILEVGPQGTLRQANGVPNGGNTERFLDDRTWRIDMAAGPVDKSGQGSLRARIAPEAFEYAEAYPSAWSLAVVSAFLFGGMTDVPKATPFGESAQVNLVIDQETALRVQKKENMERRRLERRMASSNVAASYGHVKTQLCEALRPSDTAAVIDGAAAADSK